MIDYDGARAPQPVVFDRGPSPAEIDKELADASISLLERYSAELDTAKLQARPWDALPYEQRRAMRAGNELAKRRNQAERAKQEAAEAARAEAYHTNLVETKIAAYKEQIRAAFPGTAAQFDAAWPRILEQWQIDQARQTVDEHAARIRANISF